jgi:hypothetical protein
MLRLSLEESSLAATFWAPIWCYRVWIRLYFDFVSWFPQKWCSILLEVRSFFTPEDLPHVVGIGTCWWGARLFGSELFAEFDWGVAWNINVSITWLIKSSISGDSVAISVCWESNHCVKKCVPVNYNLHFCLKQSSVVLALDESESSDVKGLKMRFCHSAGTACGWDTTSA